MIEDKAYEAALDLLKQKDLIIAKIGKQLQFFYSASGVNFSELAEGNKIDLREAVRIWEEGKPTPDIEALVKEDGERENELLLLKAERGDFGSAEQVVIADLRKSLEALERALKETGNSPNLAYKLFDMAKALEEKEAEIARLRGERCYICRPDDPMAAQEGCSDCDGRSDDFHTIETLRTQVKGLAEALLEVQNDEARPKLKLYTVSKMDDALAKFYKKEKS